MFLARDGIGPKCPIGFAHTEVAHGERIQYNHN